MKFVHIILLSLMVLFAAAGCNYMADTTPRWTGKIGGFEWYPDWDGDGIGDGGYPPEVSWTQPDKGLVREYIPYARRNVYWSYPPFVDIDFGSMHVDHSDAKCVSPPMGYLPDNQEEFCSMG